MKAIKKACSGTSLYPKKSSVSSKLKAGGKIKKAQTGTSLKDKYTNTADSLDFESRKKVYSQVNKELKNVKRSSNLDKDNKTMKQYNDLAAKKFTKDPDMINSKKYRTLADKAKMKTGGTVKAKDGKWIQKAINPAHKGFCTPESKKTCTPRRKALAHTLRKMAKNK